MIQRGKENENLCKYAYYHGFVIGSICTRIEPIPLSSSTSTFSDGSVPGAEMSSPTTESTKTMNVSSNKKRIYIMTLGVLAAYRGYGVGEQLVQSILDYYEQGRDRSFQGPDVQDLAQVEEISLHVHTSNLDAMRFYVDKFGFQKGDLIKNYYTQRIEPPDCFVLYKKL
jgi:ribosomal protein S18 acetylase RimI-like enzyme